MNPSIVYKSLIRLALLPLIVSFVVEAMAAPTAQRPADSMTNLFNDAEAAFKKGDYAKTTDLLWKNVDKLDRKGLLLLAVAHEKKKEPANMLKAANILLSKDPKDYEASYLIGTAQMLNKKHPEALEAFKTALEINPKYQPAYDKLAEMYTQRKNYYELRTLYQDMVETLGAKPAFLSKLCEINVLDFQQEQATRYCKEAISKDPKKAENYVYLGMTYQLGGEPEAAKKHLKKAADDFPQSELAQYTYGAFLDEQKNYVESTKYYLVGTKADPKATRSWSGLAKSSFEIQKYDQALEAYKNACKQDRKTAADFRKATNILRNSKDNTWLRQFEPASESCSGY